MSEEIRNPKSKIRNPASEAFRPSHEIIEQRLVEPIVGGQLDAVDRPVQALALDVGAPPAHRLQITLANAVRLRRQLFARLEIAKPDIAFQGQVALPPIEDMEQQTFVIHES